MDPGVHSTVADPGVDVDLRSAAQLSVAIWLVVVTSPPVTSVTFEPVVWHPLAWSVKTSVPWLVPPWIAGGLKVIWPPSVSQVTLPVAAMTADVGDAEGDAAAADVADADDVTAALGALEPPQARSATSRTMTTKSMTTTPRTRALHDVRASV